MSFAQGNGIVIGVVESAEDPEGFGRVRVRLPSLDNIRPPAARLVSPMAGNGRGMVFRPEPGDEVLIAFEHGDPSYPYVLGSLWGGRDRPPADDGNTPENNWRFIRTRSGHLLKFDDTADQERIELVDKTGERRLIIDTAGQRIEIVAQSGDVSVRADAGVVEINARTIKITAQEMTVDAQRSFALTATTVSLEATQGITVNGGASLKLQATAVDIN